MSITYVQIKICDALLTSSELRPDHEERRQLVGRYTSDACTHDTATSQTLCAFASILVHHLLTTLNGYLSMAASLWPEPSGREWQPRGRLLWDKYVGTSVGYMHCTSAATRLRLRTDLERKRTSLSGLAAKKQDATITLLGRLCRQAHGGAVVEACLWRWQGEDPQWLAR